MDLDYKQKRDQYWAALHAMRPEYIEQYKGLYDLNIRPPLHHWAEEKYGFKMEIDRSGSYTANYSIVDPKKFMLFQIKYWR